MPNTVQCPITRTYHASSEAMRAHIIPESLGGKTTTSAWGRVDSAVGSLFDSQMTLWVNRLYHRNAPCSITVDSVTAGAIRTATIDFGETGDSPARLHADLPPDLLTRLRQHIEIGLPIRGKIVIKPLDPRKILLSILHSALLFIAHAKTRRAGNRSLFQQIMTTALEDLESVSDADWRDVIARCHLIDVSSPGCSIVRSGQRRKSNRCDTIALNYRNVCFGVVRLDGTFAKYSAGKIDHLFILES